MVTVADDDGVELHARLEGYATAPALLFSNSLGAHLGMWDPQLEALRDRFRIIRYDSRGHGRSTVPEQGYTIERLARDALAVLDAYEIRSASFCGLSLGGMVGIWLASHAPDRVDKLVLANTAAELGPVEMWNRRIDAVLRGGMSVVADAVMERWFTPEFRSSAPSVVQEIRRAVLATSPAGYAGGCAAIRDMDLRYALKTIRTPTLVIGGAHDLATPLAKAQEIVDGICGARLVVLQASHLSNIETAAEFTSAATAFLT